MLDIGKCRKGDIIGHKKTSRAYEYNGIVKCKVDGCWVDMHMYSSYFGEIESFCRFEHDFSGFTLIKTRR
ncbi:hypothetical protein PP586_gp13 [Pseudoalteromonas phage vB_PspS-H40/1]|uniref:hypothetical protein n=1 Tax=Pseudoalteromonas phage vB_PspS-H40/1 TaxID=1856120 RepID=UPI0007DD433E|nr:hypothetical protein PP586_gp13 [Pseudoalteromonas phage vB_PspS-H40/1]ANI22030.1 hypothetical protein H401_13 [Pseudoalteromonas phage vB_PspS-H40/1]